MSAHSDRPATLFRSEESLELATERLAEIRRRFADARTERRFAITLPALAQELDEHNRPLQPAFQLIVRDVSKSGFGLLHVEPVTAPYLAIEVALSSDIEEPPTRVIAQVLRSRAIVPGLYDIGCRVVERLTAD